MSQTMLPGEQPSGADAVAYPVTAHFSAATGRRRRSGGRLTLNVVLALWLPVVGLAAWWLASAGSTSPQFPPLSRILEVWWAEFILGDAKNEILPSILNLFLGFIFGGLLGYIGGILLWRLPWVRTATNPLVYFLYVLPAPALLPAMMTIFGLGWQRQVALIAFGAVWPALLNTLDGMRGIDQIKFDTARAMRFSGARTLFSIVVPGSGPQAAAGLRASLQVAIILMVVSELVGGQQGLGRFILEAQTTFQFTRVWVGVFTLAIIGTVLNYLYMGLERLVLRWYYRSRALTG
jgi:ABC-type nitrate/sulfonate/bicarbonate transport system permease component